MTTRKCKVQLRFGDDYEGMIFQCLFEEGHRGPHCHTGDQGWKVGVLAPYGITWTNGSLPCPACKTERFYSCDESPPKSIQRFFKRSAKYQYYYCRICTDGYISEREYPNALKKMERLEARE